MSRRIGFRTIALNAQPVTEHEISCLGIAPGSHWHFEINGQPFFAKGSNFIPPDVFWPRVTKERIRSLLEAAVAGNQNMLRIWSTGAYAPDFMYDLADEMGLLLWSEFEFGNNLYPVQPRFLDTVYEEAVYQVRRVNHHPSLAHWAGGNELENGLLHILRDWEPEDYPRLRGEYVPAAELLAFNSSTILGRNRHWPPEGLNATDDDRSAYGRSEMQMAVRHWYPAPRKTDAAADFATWAWTTHVFQAAHVGAQIEFYRRGAGQPQRTLGSLYWQLKDQWAAPTCAGIDRAGRWKVLHYRARDLYSPIIVSADWTDAGARVLGLWVASDLWADAECEVGTQWFTWAGDTLPAEDEQGNPRSRRHRTILARALNSMFLGTESPPEVGGRTRPSDAVLRMRVRARGRRPNSTAATTFTHTNWYLAGPLARAELVDPGLTLTYDVARARALHCARHCGRQRLDLARRGPATGRRGRGRCRRHL